MRNLFVRCLLTSVVMVVSAIGYAQEDKEIKLYYLNADSTYAKIILDKETTEYYVVRGGTPCKMDAARWKKLMVSNYGTKVMISKSEYQKFLQAAVIPNNRHEVTPKPNKDVEQAVVSNKNTVGHSKPFTLSPRDITVSPIRPLKTSELQTGDKGVMFKVVYSADPSLVGMKVWAAVLEARKSNVYGAEGRLVIRPLYIECPDRNVLVEGDIYKRGKNRMSVKFWLLGFLPIAGSGAVMSIDDRFVIRIDE